MAEALGAVASTAQIADTALKLRNVWINIRGMPENVHNLVEDLSLLANVLVQIQNCLSSNPALQQSVIGWEDCLRTLQTANASFQNFISDLDKQITEHKRRGSIKAFLKQSKISGWEARLERLKTTTMIAQGAYTHAFSVQQSSTMLDMLQNLSLLQTSQAMTPSSLEGPPSTVPATQHKQCDRSQEEANDVNENTDFSSRCYSRPTIPGRRAGLKPTRFNLGLPSWIYRKNLQILVNRSYGLWNVNLRFYNRVSDDSDVFHAARDRHWSRVQWLFDNGDASPFDLIDNGCSLLHIAAVNRDIQGCHFLLNHGLEPNCTTFMSFSPLECFAMAFDPGKRTEKEPTMVMELVRILAPAFEDAMLGEERHTFEFYRFNTEIIRFLITSISPIYETTKIQRRVRSLMSVIGPEPDDIPLILGRDLTFRNALTKSGQLREHFIRQVAYSFAQVINDSTRIEAFTADWCPIMTDIIAFERQNPVSLRHWGSSWLIFMSECVEQRFLVLKAHEHGTIWTKKLTSALRTWVAFLKDVGVDLGVYANFAKRQFLALRYKKLCLFEQRFDIRINGFLCGPSIDHWSLYGVPTLSFFRNFGAEYESVGEFWMWVENPELFSIPGTYQSYSYDPQDAWNQYWDFFNDFHEYSSH